MPDRYRCPASVLGAAACRPACGTGGLDVAKATRILDLTVEVSELAKAEYK